MKVSVNQVSGGRIRIEAEGFEVLVDRDSPDGTKQGFRPVELFLGALGACTAGTLISFAENQGLDLSGVQVELESQAATRPERVSAIEMKLTIPGDLDAATRDRLFRVAKHCKIHNTLHNEPQITVQLTGESTSLGQQAVAGAG